MTCRFEKKRSEILQILTDLRCTKTFFREHEKELPLDHAEIDGLLARSISLLDEVESLIAIN